MAHRTSVIWDDGFTAYDFGPDHPMGPVRLDLTTRAMRITVFANVPRAMGLGGSAAVAVSIIRAMDEHFKLNLSDDDLNMLAFECEKVAHGTPSGIDNTMATYARPLLFRKGNPPLVEPLVLAKPFTVNDLVAAFSDARNRPLRTT